MSSNWTVMSMSKALKLSVRCLKIKCVSNLVVMMATVFHVSKMKQLHNTYAHCKNCTYFQNMEKCVNWLIQYFRSIFNIKYEMQFLFQHGLLNRRKGWILWCKTLFFREITFLALTFFPRENLLIAKNQCHLPREKIQCHFQKFRQFDEFFREITEVALTFFPREVALIFGN